MSKRNGQWRCLDEQVRWARRVSNVLWRARHDGSDFSIISNNCWGGAIYQSLHRPYLTPFVGTFFMASCYLNLLENLKELLAHPPRPANESRHAAIRATRGRAGPAHPIGILGDDVEIQFLHYATWEEALAKWTRRTARIRWDRLFVKFGDQNESGSEHVQRFLALPFERKICLTNRKEEGGPGVVQLGGSGPTTRLQEDFEYRCHLDVPDWLCSGNPRWGSAGRKLGRAIDAWLAKAAVRRNAARQAAGEPPELNLDAMRVQMQQTDRAVL
jgi:uncharacterized protein (DUF1919 family)